MHTLTIDRKQARVLRSAIVEQVESIRRMLEEGEFDDSHQAARIANELWQLGTVYGQLEHLIADSPGDAALMVAADILAAAEVTA